MGLSLKDHVEMYRRMLLIRRFDEEAFRLAEAGKYANYHASIGQEAISVGVCYGLTPGDGTMITHRGLGVLLMRGITLKEVFAGLYAKAPSPTRGRIPIYHMGRPDVGMLASTSMVGSVIPLAVGDALAAKLAKQDRVTITFFGDGAANRGDFHEGLNLAGIWRLPIVFVCENNFYAKSMSVSASTAGGSIVARASSYGFPGERVDGNDVLAVHEVAQKAIARARQGEGPTLLECQTFRWVPHSTAGTREFAHRRELAQWKARCPLERLKGRLLAHAGATAEQLQKMDDEIRAEVAQAIEFAEASPYAPGEVAVENVYR